MSGQMVILLNQIILLAEFVWNILAGGAQLRSAFSAKAKYCADNRINKLGLSCVKLLSIKMG